MDEYVVNNQEELCAAVMALAVPESEARKPPGEIRLGTCVYRFSSGLDEVTARRVVANIRKVSAAYFEVAP